MLLLLLTGILVCVLCYVYLKWLSVRNYWSKRNVPHNPPNPILGSLTYLMKKNTGEWMREMYTSFKKPPYIGIWLFWKPALIINSPEIARRILVKDSDIFRDRYLSSGKTDPIGALNIFTANDPLWSSVRRKITSVFTTAKLKNLQPLIVSKSKEVCQRIQNEKEQNKFVDIREIYTDYTTDIIGTSSFGVECTATLTGDCAMRRVTRDFQAFNFLRGIAFTCIFFFPEVVDFFRFKFYPKATEDYFKRIFQTVIEQRGGLDKPIEENKDLVDTLIKMKQNAAKDGEEVSMDLLTAQAAIMVHAGFETSASALTYLTYELAYSPEIQNKLYQELVAVKQTLGGKDFDMDILATATYLNCVMKESLRKYPPMGYLDRVAAKEYQIDENLTIPAGTPVYVNMISMQVDPDYFPEPEKFKPERFLPENENDIQPFTYAPFGDGPRNCIGRRFAHQTVRFALTEIILRYELRPIPGSPRPSEIKFDKQAPFLLPGEKLSVEFIPRK